MLVVYVDTVAIRKQIFFQILWQNLVRYRQRKKKRAEINEADDGNNQLCVEVNQ